MRHTVMWFLVLNAFPLPAWAQLPLPGFDAPGETAEPAPATIEAEVDLQADERIARRIRVTFAQIERLRDVAVRVDAGIVHLEGEVLSAEAREEAGRLARQVEGVVTVENGITVERRLTSRLAATRNDIIDTLYSAVAFLPLLLVAFATVLLFWILGRFVTRKRWIAARVTDNVFIQDIICQGVRVVLVMVGLVLALQILDAVALVGAVVGTAGVIGLVLGFAFRDIAENHIASLLLGIRQPFLPHDTVLIEGFEGKIVRLTSRDTVIMTWDGTYVHIPNATVYKSNIRNYSRNPQRRFDFTLAIPAEADHLKALRLGVEVLRGLDGVLDSPAPDAWLDGIQDGRAMAHYFAWINQHDTSFPKVKSEAIRRARAALDNAGIRVSAPMQELLVQSFDAARRRAEAAPHPAPDGAAPVAATESSVETVIDQKIALERATSPDRDLLTAPQEEK